MLLVRLTGGTGITTMHRYWADVGSLDKTGRCMFESMTTHFSQSYNESRARFVDAARGAGAQLVSHLLPEKRGSQGEPLTMDVAYLGGEDAKRLMIVTSGTHGPEGFCGSACQSALLRDEALLGRARAGGVALLLLHAVNPYGFSWIQRVNEDNIDLNRNAVRFPIAKAPDPRFEELQALLLPANWPRTQEQERALQAHAAPLGGVAALWKILSGGQYTFPDGLFFGGTRASWSVETVRAVLHRHMQRTTAVAWIDVHTGLGPYGHGEKICPGRSEDEPFARALWGSDALVPAQGASVSGGVSGSLLKLAHEVRPQAAAALMGLEFGTLPFAEVLDSLVADQWLRRQTAVAADVRAGIVRRSREAFYCDADDWKGAVLGQARTIFLQSLMGLSMWQGVQER